MQTTPDVPVMLLIIIGISHSVPLTTIGLWTALKFRQKMKFFTSEVIGETSNTNHGKV